MLKSTFVAFHSCGYFKSVLVLFPLRLTFENELWLCFSCATQPNFWNNCNYRKKISTSTMHKLQRTFKTENFRGLL
jgi:hypothetical protein